MLTVDAQNIGVWAIECQMQFQSQIIAFLIYHSTTVSRLKNPIEKWYQTMISITITQILPRNLLEAMGYKFKHFWT